MAVEVIGPSFGRSATMLLKSALEILGFDLCHHRDEVFKKSGEIPSGNAVAAGKPVARSIISFLDPARYCE